MADLLNLLLTGAHGFLSGAHGPAPRRKQGAMIAGGSALAILAIAAVTWGALSLRPSVPPTSPGGETRTVPSVKPAPPAAVVPLPAVVPCPRWSRCPRSSARP